MPTRLSDSTRPASLASAGSGRGGAGSWVRRIDCVAVGPHGEEAIIDFKYGGRSKYYRLIEDGKAVQLATYAYGRATPGGTFPAVAYLVLSDGLLYTPSGSPVRGDTQRYVIDAPAVQTVWDNFRQALDQSQTWLTAAAPVPARPLQKTPDWPPGATLVLDADLKADQRQEVCRYCDYRRLCGLEETL